MSDTTSWTLRPATTAPDIAVPRPDTVAIPPTSSLIAIAGRLRRIVMRGVRDDPAGTAFRARFAVLNLIGAALVAAAWVEGLAAKPYRADVSGMCVLITVLFVWGLWCVFRRDWPAVRWIGNTLVYLGMVGTVLGLIVTVSELTVDGVQNFDNFTTIVSAIFIGSGTALYTNLLACIGYLWLGTNAHLLSREEI